MSSPYITQRLTYMSEFFKDFSKNNMVDYVVAWEKAIVH